MTEGSGKKQMRERGITMIFGIYLKKLRERQGISRELLGEGLCTRQELFRLERGEWEPDYVLREAFLGRLGVGTEDFEYLLNLEEARHLEQRTQILEAVLWNRREEASERLEEYHRVYGERGREKQPPAVRRLAQQFYLEIKGYLEKGRMSREELCCIFRQAAELTLPGFEEKPLEEQVFSFAELDLILEVEQHREGGAMPEYLLKVVEYIKKKSMDGRGRAKIYPKAVCALFWCLEKSSYGRAACLLGTERERLLWEHCESSLKVLLDNGRMYYLWEILDMREKLLERKLERYLWQENWMAADTKELLKETQRWKGTLEQVYKDFQVSAETKDVCFLYMPIEIRSVNEVIRLRRRMLGMTREELCREICSMDTLRRLEDNRKMPQRGIARELLKRLGLPGEYARIELETDSQEAQELFRRLQEKLNLCRWDEAEILLKRLENMIDMEVPWNRQAILSREATVRWRRKEIDKAQYCALKRTALELTVPFTAFLQEGEKFLTHQEQTCIQNMMKGMNEEEELFLTCMKRFEEYYTPFMEKGIVGTMDGMYALIMGTTGSAYGNRGEYDRADLYNIPIIQGSLRLRRLWGLAHALYTRWWNYEERLKRGIPDDRGLDGIRELTGCLVLCEMAGDRNKELFCRKKLARLWGEENVIL